MYPPNILITNFCNQNCPFCFAKKEMGTKSIRKEMKLDDFQKILKAIKKRKEIKTIKLLGGEPTFHSCFEDIIRLSLQYFPSVQIFTNGIFTKEKAYFLASFFPKVKFTFNIMTPEFLTNKKVRQVISSHIINFSLKTEVTLSMTIDPFTDAKQIINMLSPKILKSIYSLRVGSNNPIAGEKNRYRFEDLPKIGKKVISIVKYVKKINPDINIFLNCGFTGCMFTNQQHDYLKQKKVDFPGWGCFGKKSSMDINVEIAAFHCFPLSTNRRIILQPYNLADVNRKLINYRYSLWKNYFINKCQKCPFYGHTPVRCPGPCIGFIINKY